MTTSKPAQAMFQPCIVSANEADKEITQFRLSTLLEWVMTHKLLILRGFNSLDREELLSYCAKQANLLHWDFGPVMEMKVDVDPKNYLFTEGDVPLHWDGAFYQEPRFLFFQCIEAPHPQMGGETLFVNTEKVWEDASPETKKAWQKYQLNFSTEKIAHYGGKIQRNLVTTHPETGKTILRFAEPVTENYLNPVEVSVEGKDARVSAMLLNEINVAVREEPYCYYHQWHSGDYLIADNFSLLHGRNAFKQESPRHLRRIQIL